MERTIVALSQLRHFQHVLPRMQTTALASNGASPTRACRDRQLNHELSVVCLKACSIWEKAGQEVRDIARYRALVFGQPLAAWQATKELAEQSAIVVGKGTRAPHSGFALLSPGVTIEHDEGTAPMTPDMERWAEALALVKMHGESAVEEVVKQIRALTQDPIGQAKWYVIGKRVRQVLEAAERDVQ